jgi:hypothetical protein
MRIIQTIFVFCTLLFIVSCSKEDEVMDQLKGNWQVNEIQFNADSTFKDFSAGLHTIEFWDTERAYTATGKGVYRIDYSDASLKDVADTFRFDIKEDQLSVTYTQTNLVKGLFRFRYKIQSYEGSDLFLDRTGIDTVSAHLKANRL